jgi:hypothetical protein
VKTAYSRGLGTETVDALWKYVHSMQSSGKTVGAFFKRLEQQYALVQLTEGCDFGSVTRKTLALQGLSHGAYQEVLSPWGVKKIIGGQGKTKLATATMGELQSAATDLLMTSKFYRNNVIQAGKANACARYADADDSTIEHGRQVAQDKPCDDAMIEGIVDRLRSKRNPSQGMARYIHKTFSCIHCFTVNGHHTTGCNALKEDFLVTKKSTRPPPGNTPQGTRSGIRFDKEY